MKMKKKMRKKISGEKRRMIGITISEEVKNSLIGEQKEEVQLKTQETLVWMRSDQRTRV